MGTSFYASNMQLAYGQNQRQKRVMEEARAWAQGPSKGPSSYAVELTARARVQPAFGCFARLGSSLGEGLAAGSPLLDALLGLG